MHQMRGGSKLNQIPEEDAIRDFAFATVVATKNIKEGEPTQKKILGPKTRNWRSQQKITILLLVKS